LQAEFYNANKVSLMSHFLTVVLQKFNRLASRLQLIPVTEG